VDGTVRKSVGSSVDEVDGDKLSPVWTSLRSMNIDDQPTTDLGPFTVHANGHNSATGHPNHFTFLCGVFEVGGSNGAFSGWIKFKMAAGGHF